MNASKALQSPIDASTRVGKGVRVVSLMYHDIVPEGDIEASGFHGADANKYKLDSVAFELHLKTLRATQISAKSVFSVIKDVARNSFVMTFDDGGAGAMHAARSLDRYGWCGHFLVTTDFIGKAGFLSKHEIQSLARQGHLIGSHSRSHPRRISACSPVQMVEEWRDSISVLSDILGQQVLIASVPGGYSSREVIDTAAANGVKILFTSEPETLSKEVNSCIVLGRFSIFRSTTPEDAVALVNGTSLARWKQFAAWNSKKVIKKVTGDSYVDARRWFLNRFSNS